jgi:hypothetical protein
MTMVFCQGLKPLFQITDTYILMSGDAPKHELISYNKKFKPGTAGVKLTFSPDEMAFSREDMPLRAARARREVLLSLQPQIDGVSKRAWNNDVMVFIPKEPFNPQAMYVANPNEHDPDFRRDFYDSSLGVWDGQTTIDYKLERRQYNGFTEESHAGTVKACEPLATYPLLVKRQIQYAKKIKEFGIPAAQIPPPFIVKYPKMSKKSKRSIERFHLIKYYHDGSYSACEALGGEAWSCCGNNDRNSRGCRKVLSNEKLTLYD